ncbi:MAG: substrate-binding domain-containing protein [Lachnospiraceae bacterium]|nr:substrate-binding domain-containing protein [Lachnospiraceae bacterium]
MYHNKQIAVFISHIYGEYQTNLCQGILDTASEYGYHAEVFTTSDGENLGRYNLAEDQIATLPQYDDFDGIIFASGTYVNPALRDSLSRTFLELEQSRNKRCVIEICNEPSPFRSVVLENSLTSGTLTEHLITVHGAKRICFLGTTLDETYSVKRLKAVTDALARHNLSMEEADHILCTETKDSYLAALKAFTREGASLPDGVVCYNDRIAIEFIMTAYEAGYRIPRDFAVAGCDHSKAGQSMEPPLTTVTFPAYELGRSSVKSLMEGLKGSGDAVSTVFAEPVYGGTCGCTHYGKKPGFLYARELMEHISQVESSILASLRMSSYFPMIDDLDEAISYLEEYIGSIADLTGFYMCLYGNWDQPDPAVQAELYPENEPLFAEDQVLLKLAYQNGEKLPECSFQKKSLLPAFLTASLEESVIISPLTYGERLFGYIALSFRNDRIHYPFQLIQWIATISQLLEKIRSKKQALLLTGKLEDFYYTDSLTGLYNRDGFQHFFNKEYDLLLLISLDDYGQICKNYGSQEGDFALAVLSQALTSQMSDLLLPAYLKDGLFQLALKGDEAFCEDLILKIRKYLTHYQQLNPRPYEIKARFGYTNITGSDLPFDALFAAAEEDLH